MECTDCELDSSARNVAEYCVLYINMPMFTYTMYYYMLSGRYSRCVFVGPQPPKSKDLICIPFFLVAAPACAKLPPRCLTGLVDRPTGLDWRLEK